ncbi:Glucose-6-phosphate dehydrogenase subunit [Aquisphaera giovannonii]|uniref:Glucose-6-phosphate dehydrogenase subunit n=1 Tax=Aquisphaera giovannonii TaxID=406548 RepID=A0A5B9W0S8_9BACT|nr:glucose-6-phosphate dehydrogenase assembly protein OpcA [Aquisphaera giovannonii]QEH34168.1 Glucose-6-phosphate dehydrogenase subunit [Aquisphaera giovannonii]
MASPESSTEAFLQGQGIPVDLRDIESQLQQLWGPAAERVGGPETEHPHVTRVSLANVLIERLAADAEGLRPVVEQVISKYPCRAIVIRGSDDPEKRITAEVSALCHLPDPGMPQVCSECIVLNAGPQAEDLIAGAVRPLLEADLPLVLWWTTDPRDHEALFRDLGDECSRILLDLPDPGTPLESLELGLDPTICACTRDIEWFGLTRWRELVAQFFDPPCHHGTLNRIDSLQIEVETPEPSRPPRLAIWMAAWFAGQLGWKPQGKPSRDCSPDGCTFRADFLGPMGTLAAEIVTHPVTEGRPARPAIRGVTITASGPEGAERFRARRCSPGSDDVCIDARAPDYCKLPSTVRSPEIDEAIRLVAALDASRNDPPFDNARPIALWLLKHA